MNTTNPWTSAAARRAAQAELAAAESDHDVDPTPAVTGAHQPQRGAVRVDDPAHSGLPRRMVKDHADLWLVGAHGGAGESSLAALRPGWRAAEHAWPTPGDVTDHCRVVLVARTHRSGLQAAQRTLRQWASGDLEQATELLGLVTIADAPGRLPRPLRDLATVVGGGAPRVWRLPWIEAWRSGLDLAKPPVELTRLLTDLDTLIDERTP